ncbi:hypothetical protein Daesc_000351 [Daldinia eschscholtzii]|uniref:Battenin n=1 Tax=Daldinia eschscholtzii TaxID=292717 RepID=A0AAX6MYJ2_9PEZI
MATRAQPADLAHTLVYNDLRNHSSKGPHDGVTGPGASPTTSEVKKTDRNLKLNKVTVSYFLLGILVGLPAMVTTTASSEMFTGITGVYEICSSVTAAVFSFSGPFLNRYIPYNYATIICTVASALSYVICTLPSPLGADKGNLAGPVIGTMLAGFVYAFGTNVYMAVAAFFPPEAVLALSVGSGFSVILGPSVYIGLMAAFKQSWRRTFLVFLATIVIIPIVWWGLVEKSQRLVAERSRRGTKTGTDDSETDSTNRNYPATEEDKRKLPCSRNQHESTTQGLVCPAENQEIYTTKSGFGPQRTRFKLFYKTIVPRYVVPLILCTSSATISLLGSSPTLQTLNRFRAAPAGDLQFQLVCKLTTIRELCRENRFMVTDPTYLVLSYGSAQFLLSSLSAIYQIPLVWIWTGTEVTLLVIGIIQLFYPFLTYYGVWIVVMFLVGGCVGGGVTNTNYKIAQDFLLAGEPDEVRSFAMSFAGLGNFGGDALGGALGVMVQQLATKHLTAGHR